MEKSFRRGYSQIPDYRQKEIKAETMLTLSLNNDQQWARRLRGEIFLNLAERAAIEGIYIKYGIVDIWGSEDFQSPS